MAQQSNIINRSELNKNGKAIYQEITPIPDVRYSPELGLIEVLNRALSEKNLSTEDMRETLVELGDLSRRLMNSYSMLNQKVDVLVHELKQVSIEREKEQSQKREVTSQLDTLLEFLPGGVLVLDPKGKVTKSNPAAKNMLGENLDGLLWRNIIKDRLAPKSDDGLEVSTKQGRRLSLATESLSHAGQIILITDQTETRELQKRVSQYERLTSMGKMVSVLAHQLRTPLSTALLYASHLTASPIDNPTRSIYEKKILGRLKLMEQHIRDMLLFVKSELPLNDSISIVELEKTLREQLDVPAKSKKTNIVWENTCPSWQIKCHKLILASAVMNLVNNAIQASSIGETIYLRLNVSIRQDTPWLNISVIDHGCGISEEILAKVSEMFVSTRPQGSGLGLAIAKSITKAHGGILEIHSEIGRGTHASILIPMADQFISDE